MAALQQNLNQRGGMGMVLSTFEDIVVDQTKSFLLLLGKEFPDLIKIAQKIEDIESIRRKISIIALISYTGIYNKRPQGLELHVLGQRVDEVANLKILIESIAAGIGIENYEETGIDAEAILIGTSRADTALNIHNFIRLLDELRLEVVHVEEEGEDSGEDSEGSNEDGAKNRFLSREGGHIKSKTKEESNFRNEHTKQRERSHQQKELSGKQMEEVNMRIQKVNKAKKERSSNLYTQGGKGLIQKGGKKQDPLDKMEGKAIDELTNEQKHKAARIRRMKALHLKRQKIRSSNLRRNERRSEIKRQSMWAELERMEFGRKVQADMDNKRSVERLMKEVLNQLSREVYEDNLMNSEHLRALEQQRISQTAASSALFADRANMIKEKKLKAQEAHAKMIREQEKHMDTVFREAEMKHNSTIEDKMNELNMMEEAAWLREKESRHAIAELFNSTRLDYLADDRINVPKSPFEKTLREIRSNALQLRQQQIKMRKEKQLHAAYGGSVGVHSGVAGNNKSRSARGGKSTSFKTTRAKSSMKQGGGI